MARILIAALAAAALLLSSAHAAPAAPPIRGALYTGVEGQLVDVEDEFAFAEGTVVEFRVSRDGRSIRELAVFSITRCPNGRFNLAVFTRRRLPIRRGGTFSATLSDLRTQPFARSNDLSLEGSFRRAGRAARLSVHQRTVGNDGTTCDRGPRTVVARAEPPERLPLTG